MSLRIFLTVWALLGLGQIASATPSRPPPLSPGTLTLARRVVVLGDSITYAGTYVDFLEAAIRLTEPDWHGELLDVGLPSETVSGLSEPGHADGRFPRPDLHERLARVLAQTKPDLVLACYGMNDGIYLPFGEERFAKFQAGMRWLYEQVIAAHSGIVHLTPPVYDPQPVHGKAAEYSAVLDRYSDWLLAQRSNGWAVIDVHGPMREDLAARRATVPDFFYAKDGVHPNRLGHAVMARAILAGFGFPPAIQDAPLGWSEGKAPDWLPLISQRRKLLSDAWLTATGHQRPGMAKGKPLEEAQREAGELDARIRKMMAEVGAAAK